MYTVSEDEGMVEVCAVVSFPSGSCPIQFPFDIRLETDDGTAGKTLVNLLICIILQVCSYYRPLPKCVCHHDSVYTHRYQVKMIFSLCPLPWSLRDVAIGVVPI